MVAKGCFHCSMRPSDSPKKDTRIPEKRVSLASQLGGWPPEHGLGFFLSPKNRK